MEVKIGVQFGSRELTVDVAQSPDEVYKELDATLTKGGIFRLTDGKGKEILVPVDKIAYIEVDNQGERVVGFGRI